MNRFYALLLLCAVGLLAQEKTTKVQRFEGWGSLMKDPPLESAFMMGFTNGLFSGATSIACADARCAAEGPARKKLLACVVTDRLLSENQAIALTDRYYIDHPEDWHLLMGEGILKALTVKGSPCEGMEPRKDR